MLYLQIWRLKFHFHGKDFLDHSFWDSHWTIIAVNRNTSLICCADNSDEYIPLKLLWIHSTMDCFVIYSLCHGLFCYLFTDSYCQILVTPITGGFCAQHCLSNLVEKLVFCYFILHVTISVMTNYIVVRLVIMA